MAWRFGPFVLDPDTRRLLRGGVEIHLSPKAFDLLQTLVAARERAVPRPELHQRLWPSTFVQDTNLASLVAEIRRALDDSAEHPRFVRTVHRVGYWFVGDAREVRDRDGRESAPVRYWLVWESRQVALREGENILGRAPDAEVWIDASGVSRRHARVTVAGEAVLEDLQSKNGTFVGSTEVDAPYVLADGDQIRLGSVVLTFRVPPPAGPTDTLPGR